jgi:hypothetical protein
MACVDGEEGKGRKGGLKLADAPLEAHPAVLCDHYRLCLLQAHGQH